MLLVISYPGALCPALLGPWVLLGKGWMMGPTECWAGTSHQELKRKWKSEQPLGDWLWGFINHFGPIFSLSCDKERTSVSPHCSIRPTVLCVSCVRKYHFGDDKLAQFVLDMSISSLRASFWSSMLPLSLPCWLSRSQVRVGFPSLYF